MSIRPRGRFLDRKTPPTLFTLILLASISALCMNIFLPSLPSMAAYFDTEYKIMQLSVAVYLAINGVLQLVIGPISDKLGRRPVILGGLTLFLVATLGCIFAPTASVFLAFRMMQACVVVGMVLSRAVVRDMVPADEAASMIGYVTMGMTVVPMLGPMVGGALDHAFGWQASFWLLFAVGLVILFFSYTDLGETKVASGLTLAQQFREFPELFFSPRFWGYTMATAFNAGAFFAFLGGAPFVATEIFGMSPARMGVYFGAPAIGYFLGNFISGRFSSRIGINRMVVAGGCVVAFGISLSLLLFPLGLSTPETFFGLMSFVGLGNGMAMPNATSGALSVRPHLAGTASGFSGAIMLGGGAALSALAGAALGPGSGAYPLLLIMLATTLLSIVAISIVIRRERQLGL